MHMVYRIRGHVIKWVESFLYDRSQYVIYNNEYSETHHLNVVFHKDLYWVPYSLLYT